ncbi:hypothetical protein OROGR_027005 [Orobanche gracilis]
MFLIIPAIYIASFLLFLYIWWWHKYNKASPPPRRLPPSPRKLPLIGNLHQLGLHPHRSLQSLSQRYGPLMLLHLGVKPVLLVSSVDAAREIMKNQDVIFSNRPSLSIADRLFYSGKNIGFAPYGDYWRKMRSICVLRLLSNTRVQSFRRVRDEETSRMVDNIRKSPSPVVNLSETVASLSNGVIARVALGRSYIVGEQDRKNKALFRELSQLAGTFCVRDSMPWLGWIDRLYGLDARVESMAKRVDEFMEGVIQEHRSTKKGQRESNFVDILLQLQRENKDSLDDDSLKGVIMDIFGAGTETLSTSLEWTMSELIKNPRTMKILQEEVRRVSGTRREVDEDDLEKMPYLKAVFKEGLRLHTPVPLLIPRASTHDTQVMGYDIAAGTQIMVNAWTIARDPSVWENPEAFEPERFLNTSIDYKGQHFELIPFGAGRRICPGTEFAAAVSELALAKLVHAFDFDLPDGTRKEDLEMAESNGIAVHKKHPLLVVPSPYII